jgi:hypothetical protein
MIDPVSVLSCYFQPYRGEFMSAPKPVIPGMRLLLIVAALLVFIVGVQLYIFTEQTEQFFAWTIANPLTAAFLGGAYWSSCLLEVFAARERFWANARLAIPAVLLFTGLTFIVTLIHLDKFHLGDRFAPLTQFVTWVWIGVYLSVPVVMSILLIRQVRTPGSDPARVQRLPLWLRVIFGLYALLMLPLGVGLLLAPGSVSALWPWTLTPLTAQAIGAWMIGLGVTAAQIVIENDWRRVQPGLAGLALFGALALVAILRYPAPINMGNPNSIFYVIVLISMLLIGLYGSWRALASRRNTNNPESG